VLLVALSKPLPPATIEILNIFPTKTLRYLVDTPDVIDVLCLKGLLLPKLLMLLSSSVPVWEYRLFIASVLNNKMPASG
jgi:hypothetical protein